MSNGPAMVQMPRYSASPLSTQPNESDPKHRPLTSCSVSRAERLKLLVDGSAPFTSLTIHDDNENWTEPAPLLKLKHWQKTIKQHNYFVSATHVSNPLCYAKFSHRRHTATVETLAIYPFQYKALSSLG